MFEVADRQDTVECDQPICVLVVEDDELVRRMVVRLLTNWGYVPIEAADGCEAVDRFLECKNNLHLVLLDIMLPRLSGVEVARAIRGEDPRLPIVICSAILDCGVRDELRDLNIQRCLDKPVRVEMLRSTLAETLQERDELGQHQF